MEGHGQQPRERGCAARNQARLLQEVAQAKKRLGLPESAPVASCYEAGREASGCIAISKRKASPIMWWIPSSIEVKRRQRPAKSNGLDVHKLLTMLMRFHHGERDVWRVGHVPTVEAED